MTEPTTPSCAGCVGCGGPDCIERPELEGDVPARTIARRRLQALGLSEAEAVALLLPVIAETYREVADDAAEGVHGATWGETVPEALAAFAEAYRQRAADCDLPGAPMPDTSPAVDRERAAHEEHRRQLADALNEPEHADWLSLTTRARQFRAGRSTWKAKAAEIEADRDRLAEELERARRGETEAVRARDAAEQDARRALEQRQQMAAERYALQQRAEKAERAVNLLADAERNRQTAEAALARVRALLPDNPRDDKWTDAVDAASVRAALDGTGQPAEQQPDPGGCVRCGHTPEVHRGYRGCTVLVDEDVHCPCELSEVEATDPSWAEAPCLHPAWETHGRARKCTDCGEWLDPEPQQAAEPQPIVISLHLAGGDLDRLIRAAIRRYGPGGL